MKKNIIVIFFIIVLDQLIKYVILKTVGSSNESIILIPNVLALTYTKNVGAAFGMFVERIFLIGLNLMIIFFVIKIMVSKKYNFGKIEKMGMSLIVAGGTGNLIDRLFRGYVIDYIDITQIFNYPIFNLADISIVLGVIIIIVTIIINTIKIYQ